MDISSLLVNKNTVDIFPLVQLQKSIDVNYFPCIVGFLFLIFLECHLEFGHLQAEKKKRKAQLQEANRKKIIKRVERKMAAVAREKAWAQRLAELQQLEEEKQKSMA